jgi:hypothetical protein
MSTESDWNEFPSFKKFNSQLTIITGQWIFALFFNIPQVNQSDTHGWG